ncbi:MAG: helix-turn-helix transcriptional regulator [Henriciella sp.]
MNIFLASNEVESRYKISRSTIYRWIQNPNIQFPEPIKIGHRNLWRAIDLDNFDNRFECSEADHVA